MIPALSSKPFSEGMDNMQIFHTVKSFLYSVVFNEIQEEKNEIKT